MGVVAHQQLMEAELASLVRESQRLVKAGDWGPAALAVNAELVGLGGGVGARRRLALCLEEAGRYEEALAEFERVVADARPDRDDAEDAQRRISIVQAYIDSAKTTSFEAANKRARALRDEAKVNEALIWHERAVELARTPRDQAIALVSWSSTLRPVRRLVEAMDLVSRAIAVDDSRTTNTVAFVEKIAVLNDQGKVQGAVDEAEKLLALHPTDRHVLAVAGRTFMAMAKRSGDDSYRDRANRCFALANR
jgi:tetratricopeptide (TPR) repeat protein